MKFVFAGGGTLGSVLPLVAIAQKIQEKDTHTELLWIGTATGPEKVVIESYSIPFVSIPAGKFRRYISFKNITDTVSIFLGFLKAFRILFFYKPDVLIGAGSFIQVPVIYAAGIFFKKTRIIIHQQDIKKGLANTLCERFADLITVSTEKSLADFPEAKTSLTGNPIREEILKGGTTEGFKLFKKVPTAPVVLILGGGTGSQFINALVANSLTDLTAFCSVLHITGQKKYQETNSRQLEDRYRSYPLLTKNLAEAYSIADIVISRAGFSTISELAALAKPTILIPIPKTHQEENAKYFLKKNAVIMLEQEKLTNQKFVKTIKELLDDAHKRFALSSAISNSIPPEATNKFLDAIRMMLDKTIKVKKW
jgi:UDP-N-acetylglucosamine--N-acetylmuramyl-(pentapeptide) pyrophosphoryl-undecaprenol N-acetylglucosamine transferase